MQKTSVIQFQLWYLKIIINDSEQGYEQSPCYVSSKLNHEVFMVKFYNLLQSCMPVPNTVDIRFMRLKGVNSTACSDIPNKCCFIASLSKKKKLHQVTDNVNPFHNLPSHTLFNNVQW